LLKVYVKTNRDQHRNVVIKTGYFHFLLTLCVVHTEDISARQRAEAGPVPVAQSIMIVGHAKVALET
jgi:hypothetical protein